MSGLAGTRFLVRVVALATSVVYLSACTGWKVQHGPVAATIQREMPLAARIELVSQERFTLHRPFVVDDRLVGIAGTPGRQVSYPLDEIVKLEFEGVSAGKTVGLVAGSIGVTGLLLYLLVRDSFESQSSSGVGLASCPFVYSWDGSAWRLDSGTFGGAIARPLQRTDLDNLDFATAHRGQLNLRMRNELDEIEHVDAVEVLAVDHAPGVTVSPGAGGRIHALGPLVAPIRATDAEGGDVLARVLAADGRNWESRLREREPSHEESLRDGIEIEFPKPADATSARLVVDARNTPWSAFLIIELVRTHGRKTSEWYASMEADPKSARDLQALLARAAFLRTSVFTDHGWEEQGTFWEAGPEVVKRQVLALDLSAVSSPLVRVRLEAPPSFWLLDAVAIDFAPERSFEATSLAPTRAVDRHGEDVRQRMLAIDGRYFTMERGDGADLTFEVPPIGAGQARSYLLRSTGWYRILVAEEGEPDLALLESLKQPFGVERASVARVNATLNALRMQAQVQP